MGHERAQALEGQGLDGCAHANPPMREVLFVSREHLDSVGVEPGAIRENLTVEGLDVQQWPVGQRVRVGGAVFEITMVCDPCTGWTSCARACGASSKTSAACSPASSSRAKSPSATRSSSSSRREPPKPPSPSDVSGV